MMTTMMLGVGVGIDNWRRHPNRLVLCLFERVRRGMVGAADAYIVRWAEIDSPLRDEATNVDRRVLRELSLRSLPGLARLRASLRPLSSDFDSLAKETYEVAQPLTGRSCWL